MSLYNSTHSLLAANCTNDENGKDPCYGNGTCYDHPGSKNGYFCDCLPSFFGPRCNFSENACLNVNETELCSSHGRCVTEASTEGMPIPVCICDDFYFSTGFETLFCDQKLRNCATSRCVYGHCTADEPMGLCYCKPGRPLCTSSTVIINTYTHTHTGYTGAKCNESIDVCQDRCYNGGTCTPMGHYYNCSCPNGYTGERCEYQIDPCSQQPCQNNGQCVPSVYPGDNGYYLVTSGSVQTTCQCGCGFKGEDCGETNDVVDICTLNPCGPTGECRRDNSSSGFSCVCPDGLAGDLCDQPDHCSSLPCNPERTTACLNAGAGAVCVCAGGWGGPDCSMDINECARNPCVNGNCSNSLGGYQCSCPSGWTGSHCDEALSCADVECDNSGACVMSEGVAAVCDCPRGYHGDRCELEGEFYWLTFSLSF